MILNSSCTGFAGVDEKLWIERLGASEEAHDLPETEGLLGRVGQKCRRASSNF
jgi:hypothetical protein